MGSIVLLLFKTKKSNSINPTTQKSPNLKTQTSSKYT